MSLIFAKKQSISASDAQQNSLKFMSLRLHKSLGTSLTMQHCNTPARHHHKYSGHPTGALLARDSQLLPESILLYHSHKKSSSVQLTEHSQQRLRKMCSSS